MAPTLLVLAAGMGSRYGGLKQVDPVGPSGETVLDYGVYDAIRAGFGKVVFVIRKEFEDEFRSKVTAKYSGKIEVGFVFQALSDLPAEFTVPEGREKPWGTGHAVWCARNAVTGPFAVINADDFYGASSYSQLADFLRKSSGSQFAIVGFKLANTLSENGTVSRGICSESGNFLLSIREDKSISRTDVGPGARLSGDERVSMNFWGFTPDVFAGLDAGLRSFLQASSAETKSEFYLPAAVSDMIKSGSATVAVIPSAESWFGITYKEDKARVVSAVETLVQSRAYPAKLF